MEYVRHRTSIPVLHIKVFNLTDDNPLKTPYILQTRISGVSLQSVLPDMSHKQWCSVAGQLGHIILELQQVTNTAPGLIENSGKIGGFSNLKVSPFDIRKPFDSDWKKKQETSLTFETDNERYLYMYKKDTFRFLVIQLARWRSEELHQRALDILDIEHMHHLINILIEIYEIGYFSDRVNCLLHINLTTRNIMVELGSDDSIKITGVLDWDSTIFAPRFVACRPPWWL